MIPEETNPTQTRPEETLPPTFESVPESATPTEPVDDGTFTPPHGDPVGEAALETATPVVQPPASPDHNVSPLANTSFVDSHNSGSATVETGAEQPELLYAGPVEPAPAGAWFPEPERRPADAEPTAAAPDHETVTDAAHLQPDVLCEGPVEAVPAGLHFAEAEETRVETETHPVPGEASTLTAQLPHDDLEAAALASGAVAPHVEPESPVELEEQAEGGPNWMLAFICAWSSAISLREAWATIGGGGLGMALRNLGVLGYLLLGFGLLAFALDALRWGRPRRGLAQLVVPTLLTLAGVVCLVLWNDRGRPI